MWRGGGRGGVLFEVSQGEMGETGMSQRKGSRGRREEGGGRGVLQACTSMASLVNLQTWIPQPCAPEASDPQH